MLPFNRPLLGTVLRATLLAALAASCLALAVWGRGDVSSLPVPDLPAPDGEAAKDLCRDILRRALEKDRLAGEVIEGRLSLVDAAARYRDLDEQPPPFSWSNFRSAYPGDSDDERHCRAVIVFVRAELASRPGADPAVVGRLEAELHDLLNRGEIRLPRPETPPPDGPPPAPGPGTPLPRE